MKRAILIILLNVYLFTFIFCPAHAEPQKASFARAERLFLEGQYVDAASETGRLLAMRAPHRDEIYYLNGLSLLKLNRFKEARESFAKVISKYQISKRTFDAYMGIGDSYFLEGDMTKATRSYEEMIKRYPHDSNIILVRRRLDNCRSDTQQIIKEPKASSSFSVQVGYFKNRSNAERQAKKLKRKDYDSYIDIYSDSGSAFYRVKVGKFESNEEAQKLASELRDLGYSTKICTDDFS